LILGNTLSCHIVISFLSNGIVSVLYLF
jgi:hypothetical protein